MLRRTAGFSHNRSVAGVRFQDCPRDRQRHAVTVDPGRVKLVIVAPAHEAWLTAYPEPDPTVTVRLGRKRRLNHSGSDALVFAPKGSQPSLPTDTQFDINRAGQEATRDHESNACNIQGGPGTSGEYVAWRSG